MKKNKIILVLITCIYVTIHIYPATKTEFLQDMFSNFYDVMDEFNLDYAKISGLNSAGGVFKGSASSGNFPSFSIGSSMSVVFMTNPIDFLKKIDFIGTDWNSIKNSLGGISALDWFDDNFLPIPVTVHHFEIGLPKGFFVGGHFSLLSGAELYSSIGPTSLFSLSECVIANGGIDTGYTIMNGSGFLPRIAVGMGFDYSEVRFKIEDIDIGTIYLDDNNTDVSSELSFGLVTRVPSVTTSFSISKRFLFFEPFFDVRISQSFYYNETEITIAMDTSDMTSSTQDLYGDGRFTITNKDDNGIGITLPETECVVSTGFQLIAGWVRFGIGVSYGMVSQEGMATFDVSFQLEQETFTKKQKKVSVEGDDA